MKKIIVTVLTILVAAAAIACVALYFATRRNVPDGPGMENTSSDRRISQEDAKARMDSGSDLVVLDVRTEEEFAGGHIAGAVCIPVETIDESVRARLPDPEQTILVYCRTGRRSVQAAEKLAALGYPNVLEFGGVSTWPYGLVTD